MGERERERGRLRGKEEEEGAQAGRKAGMRGSPAAAPDNWEGGGNVAMKHGRFDGKNHISGKIPHVEP